MTMALLAFGKWMHHNIVWILLVVLVGGLSGVPVLDHRARARFCGRVPDAACRCLARSG